MGDLSHIDEKGQPTMVDVGDKAVTHRAAVAEAIVRFPGSLAVELKDGELVTGKGPVGQTAIIAGTMAAKKTHELIPFCHPLGLERCRLSVSFEPDQEGSQARVRCEVAVSHKTGVEMEALTGASVAALTIYDMCKALSHDIVIGPVRLVEKTGGKSDFNGGGS